MNNTKNSKAEASGENSSSVLPASGSNPIASRSISRAPAKSFQDLEIWQRAHAFVLEVYRITASFPQEERFGLVSQFRRAAVSIPANIAEGFRKYGPADKARFLNIAEGSLEECRYYCILSQDLGYGDTQKLGRAATYIRRVRNQ